MAHEIVVPDICIKVVTGPTCYPDEGGFAAIYAELVTNDKSLIATLTSAMPESGEIGLRCAGLDVIGRVTKVVPDKAGKKIVLAVEDLRYRKPYWPSQI